MKYLGADELTEIMGIGYLGEIRRGPDGALYQWVEGVDGFGNVSGWWSKIKKGVKSVAKKASQLVRRPYCIPLQAIPGPVKGIAKRVCQVVGKLSPLAHVPIVGGYYKGAAKLCKIAKDCGIAGLESGLMDGTFGLYQGLSEDEDLLGMVDDEVLYGLGQENLTEMMGLGYLGQVRRGPDGEMYQWIEGIDGLGRRKQFWHCRRCLAIKKRLAQRKKQKQQAVDSAAAQAIPSVSPQAAMAAMNGLGQIFQGRDGRVYQKAGLAADEELYGLAVDDEDLYGLADDEDLYGIGEDDEDLYGFGDDDEDLYGIGVDDEDLYGLEEDEEDLYGVDGYINVDDGVNGLEAYVSDKPPGNRMFVKPAMPPEIWKPLW